MASCHFDSYNVRITREISTIHAVVTYTFYVGTCVGFIFKIYVFQGKINETMWLNFLDLLSIIWVGNLIYVWDQTNWNAFILFFICFFYLLVKLLLLSINFPIEYKVYMGLI
jgi:hypothetical protein